ncbi:phage holin [uncultured Abiotrophia sp.]|uniref:phage holin n=1 Tax=uncultured Abiotrophia sp. TaxID=316094 RepID=UPI00205E612D|nr:phage holin [uncultured Abiotrophia sp.]DAX58119.1 MAG TPA: holin [Caudoviricetes sp.]
MNINLKLRLQHKSFWVALVGLVVLLSQQLGVKIFPDNIADITNTVLAIGVLVGVINDPTTAGLGDSAQALEYTAPKES